MRIRLRRLFCWKSVFYGWLLPGLARLGPARCDAVLCRLGRASARLRPAAKAGMVNALRRAKEALDLDGPVEESWPELASNTARILARDYALDCRSDQKVFAQFEVRGREPLDRSLANGRGAILVGCHLGAYIAGLHWLFRGGHPVRALVQRPCHVSGALDRCLDDDADRHPQSGFFLRRDLSPGAAVKRIVRARAALRDGMAVYLNGDIPWHGPNTRPGCLLGVSQGYLSTWTELAALTGAPVFLVFCTHRPGGRFALEFEAVGRIQPGKEDEAVADYFKQLEARIADSPTQAVAHLLWPCYSETTAQASPPRPIATLARIRPSRRVPAVSSS